MAVLLHALWPLAVTAREGGRSLSRYKLRNVTSLSNVEKQFVLAVPNKSETVTIEETSAIQKTLLNEEPATEEACLKQKTLKSYECHQETFLMEKPLTLLGKTDDDNEFETELMASEGKEESEEAAVIEVMPDLKESVIGKVTLTSSSLYEKKKQAVQRDKYNLRDKSFFGNKPSALNVVSTREKSLIKMPLLMKKNPTTKMKSLLQEPLSQQKIYKTQEEASTSKKTQVLQVKSKNKEGKHSTNEVTHTKKEPSSKKNHDTQGKGTNFRSPRDQPVTHANESSSLKMSTTKKDSHFQGQSVLPDRHITEMEASTVETSLALQKPTTEAEVLPFQVAPVLEKQHSTEEVLHKKHSSKRRHSINNPATQEAATSEPLSFKKSTTRKDSPIQKPYALRKTHTNPRVSSKVKKPHVPQKHDVGEESDFQLSSDFKKWYTVGEPASTKKPLMSEMQQTTTQGTGSYLKNPLVLQTATSGAESLTEEAPSFKKENNTSSLKRKCATSTCFSWLPQSERQETIDEDKNLFSVKPGPFREASATGYLQNPSSLSEQCSISPELSFPAIFASKESTSQEGTCSKVSATSNDDKELFSQDLFSPYSSADEDARKCQKSLGLQEKTSRKNDSSKKMIGSQDSVSEEESFLRKLFYKGSYSSEESSQERAVALEQEFMLKKILEESNSSDIDESHGHHSLHFQDYPSTEKEASEEPENSLKKASTEQIVALIKSLVTQDNSIKEAFLNKYTMDIDAYCNQLLTLPETSVKEEATLKEPLALQEKPRTQLATVLKELLVLIKKPNVEKVALALQENQSSNVETLLKEVLALVEKPRIEGSTTLKEPLALQEEPSTKTGDTPKEWELSKESLTFDQNPNIEEDDISRKTLTTEESNTDLLFKGALALGEGLTAVDQLSFSDPSSLEDTVIIDEETFSKSLLAFPNEKSPHESSPCESGSKNSQSPTGETQTEVIILDDSDTLEIIENEDNNPSLNSVYDKEIFSYLKKREEKFILEKYMDRQAELSIDLRAILVDWLVEVQMCFQMSHETLYLAVKIVDLYLMKAQCKKKHLQLLGSTAYMIAAKLEESYPPSLKEFFFICEDVYKQRDMVSLEIKILKTLDFDINIPTAYNFLRRYASYVSASMKTLTLSRFICELTLTEYGYIQEKPSKLAAASFILALYMRNLSSCVPVLEYYSGYQIAELHSLIRKLNNSVTFQPLCSLKNVYEKYSEEAFFEVAKIPPLNMEILEELLNYALSS
ncbi:G2/mitotic-specific cyclin-B3 [Acomys russatus]|uniref:G2/mitotic-specific cyclin-B3 n=1 Tax=Acomys russatus TaxID=60746 RepID=UPI0021E2115A|nr:G2/mitotic-specific cyclin-B3 [Acomys russatus]